MEQLRSRDLVSVLACLPGIYAQTDPVALAVATVGAIGRLIPSTAVFYHQIDLDTQRMSMVVDPPAARFADDLGRFNRHFMQHPVLRHLLQTGAEGVHTVSDFLTQREFQALDLYQECYRPLGIDYQLVTLVLGTGAPVVCLVVGRDDRDFDARERDLLAQLLPHLAQAHRTALTLARQARPEPPHRWDLLGVSADGGIVIASDVVWRWLRRFFGPTPIQGGRLPKALADWFHAARVAGHDESGLTEPEPFVAEIPNERLVIRLLPVMWDDLFVLSVEEHGPDLTVPALEHLGLTRREAEVLTLVAQGKTSAAIAEMLAISRRTVETHLEHVYRKLGVVTRTAAVARAFEIVERGTGAYRRRR